MDTEPLPRKLAVILYADVAGYSRLTGEDEDATHRILGEYLDLISQTIERHHGQVLHYAGDALLAKFDAVVDALSGAVAIQDELWARNQDLPDERRVQFRIGVNLGDVIEDRGDIYGNGVNVAARLEALAEPGGVCISESVRTAVGTRFDLSFESMGEHEVKNIAEPLRAYKIVLRKAEIGGKFTSRSPEVKVPDRPSIAVLPFINMSGDPEQEYFSDGMTEDIITELSRVSGLFVVARSSVFTYKGKAVKVGEISDDLSVRYVLEGSVRKAGNRVRITVKVVNGVTGDHVWGERYDRDLTDIFELQDDIAQSIVGALKVVIAPREKHAIEKIPTDSFEAYEYYLRGRQFLHEMTKKNLERAREMFSNAIELDSDYVHAHAGLADCGSVLYLYYTSNPEVLNDALAVSQKALELDPGLAEAHVSRGLALSLNEESREATREFETAIQLDPMLYEAYWYFGLTSVVLKGMFERAAKLFEQASQVRSDDLQSLMMLMASYQGSGRYADARAAAERTIEMVERRLELNPEDSRAAYGGATALVYMDDRARALKWANLSAEIESEDSRTNYNLACLYSLLGDVDKAIDYLELSIRGGRPVRMIPWAESDPDFDAVRSQPRFQALLRKWADGDLV